MDFEISYLATTIISIDDQYTIPCDYGEDKGNHWNQVEEADGICSVGVSKTIIEQSHSH